MVLVREGKMEIPVKWSRPIAAMGETAPIPAYPTVARRGDLMETNKSLGVKISLGFAAIGLAGC